MPNRLDDVYNVKDFGAVGNGIHDDAPNIQAAIAASANGGSSFFLQGSIGLVHNWFCQTIRPREGLLGAGAIRQGFKEILLAIFCIMGNRNGNRPVSLIDGFLFNNPYPSKG